MHYEYEVLKTEVPTVSEKQLDDYGKEGWMLQCIVPWNGEYYYYFMRVIDS